MQKVHKSRRIVFSTAHFSVWTGKMLGPDRTDPDWTRSISFQSGFWAKKLWILGFQFKHQKIQSKQETQYS